MATTVLAEGAERLIPVRKSSDWRMWASTFGEGLRKTLLAYRDGARMVSGTRLTNTEYLKTTERIGNEMVAAGFSVRAAVVLFSTIYNYRSASLWRNGPSFQPPASGRPSTPWKGEMHVLTPPCFLSIGRHRPSFSIDYDRRFREGLELILRGARPGASPHGDSASTRRTKA